ncbi:DLW-39 family protein [Tessaracoccus sp. OH4464_COT-324]|nr:DLW-39 family protein [Tessaracoccus sp. OH4464_COT-324]
MKRKILLLLLVCVVVGSGFAWRDALMAKRRRELWAEATD